MNTCTIGLVTSTGPMWNSGGHSNSPSPGAWKPLSASSAARIVRALTAGFLDDAWARTPQGVSAWQEPRSGTLLGEANHDQVERGTQAYEHPDREDERVPGPAADQPAHPAPHEH